MGGTIFTPQVAELERLLFELTTLPHIERLLEVQFLVLHAELGEGGEFERSLGLDDAEDLGSAV